MIKYDDYIKRYDDMDEDEFDILVLNVTLFLETYCELFISQFKLKDNFEDYGLDLDEAIIQQLHFANENGGLSFFDGNNDVMVKSVSTSGFSYSYGKSDIKTYKGIPIAPMTSFLVEKELRKKGYLGRCVYA